MKRRIWIGGSRTHRHYIAIAHRKAIELTCFGIDSEDRPIVSYLKFILS